MMVSVHYYDPWDYCGTEDLKTILWGEYGDNLIEVNGFPKMNKAKWGDESYLDDLFTKMQDKFVKNDIPVIPQSLRQSRIRIRKLVWTQL